MADSKTKDWENVNAPANYAKAQSALSAAANRSREAVAQKRRSPAELKLQQELNKQRRLERDAARKERAR